MTKITQKTHDKETRYNLIATAAAGLGSYKLSDFSYAALRQTKHQADNGPDELDEGRIERIRQEISRASQ